MDYRARVTQAITESKTEKKSVPANSYHLRSGYNQIAHDEIDAIAEFLKFIDQGELKIGKPRVVRNTTAELKTSKRPSWGVKLNAHLIISKKEKYFISLETFPTSPILIFHINKAKYIWNRIGDHESRIFTETLFENMEEKFRGIRSQIYAHKEEVKIDIERLIEVYLVDQRKRQSGTKGRFYRKWKNASKYDHVKRLFELPKEEFCQLMHKIATEENFRKALLVMVREFKEYGKDQFESLDALPDDELLKIMRYVLKNPSGIHGLTQFVDRNGHDFEIVERSDIDELYDTAAAEHLLNA